ncbi:MAG: hypothetical protein KBT82_16605 [Marinobacter sp.]|nr:hypothetical protein [Marinobacter sp.]MBQ0815769.1 hypothetical protein [Marinobacter sp.]|tara:strand:+ start:5930 stop:6457 length:528 start_codon:yes stop_codon:yes gene_type:complete
MSYKMLKCVPLLIGFSLSGCAVQEKLSLGVENPCASLQNIVADYDSGFASYRGKASSFNSMTVFRAKEQIISGHCEVWAWANNDSAYICSSTAPNEDVASAMYEKSIASVAQCIGNTWKQEAEAERIRDGEAAGVATRFAAQKADTPGIAVHRVDYRSDNSVYIYIGPTSRRDHF